MCRKFIRCSCASIPRNPAGDFATPLCVRHFSSPPPRVVPTWSLCLYLICRIRESYTGGLNGLPTNYAPAQNVIGPRGTVRRHPHCFGFLCANEARRSAAVRCARGADAWTHGRKATSFMDIWGRVLRVRGNAEVVLRGEWVGYTDDTFHYCRRDLQLFFPFCLLVLTLANYSDIILFRVNYRHCNFTITMW